MNTALCTASSSNRQIQKKSAIKVFNSNKYLVTFLVISQEDNVLIKVLRQE